MGGTTLKAVNTLEEEDIKEDVTLRLIHLRQNDED
jgi:hypothetical protein